MTSIFFSSLTVQWARDVFLIQFRNSIKNTNLSITVVIDVLKISSSSLKNINFTFYCISENKVQEKTFVVKFITKRSFENYSDTSCMKKKKGLQRRGSNLSYMEAILTSKILYSNAYLCIQYKLNLSSSRTQKKT